MNSKEDLVITLLISTFGMVLGWIIGIYSSPTSEEEEAKINRFSTLIGSFLTGYILSKIDGILDEGLKYDNLTGTNGIRLLFFLCSFGLAWVIVFVYRQTRPNDFKESSKKDTSLENKEKNQSNNTEPANE